MSHRTYAVERSRRGEQHRSLEVFIWLLIALVLFVMIRLVLMGPVLASLA